MSEFDKDKLKEVLEENDVTISKKGNICLYDFVDNIIESKNPKLYIKKLTDYNKMKINGEYYITQEDCVDMLKNSNFKRCKEVYTKIQLDDEDDSSMIDVENGIFQFEGHKFLSFFIEREDDWEVYLKGSEVAKYLGYADTEQAISEHVDEENKCTFLKLCELFGQVQNTGQKNIDKKTIFITLPGFFNLIHHSKKILARKIKKWIDNEVLPSLVKTGTYTMQPKQLLIKSFYDNNSILLFDNKAVLYIAYIGKHKGEHLFKFGFTRNIYTRECKQHRKTFKEFQIVFIGESDNCEEIERLFKKDIKARKLHRNGDFNGKTQTELFTVTNKLTHEYFINFMKQLIIENQLPAIKDANTQISNLSNVVDTYKQFEQIKKLEYEFKMSDNYKLEVEKEIKIKELDSETAIALKNIEVELQREKNKQIAMENGYDPLLFYASNKISTKKKSSANKGKEIVRI